MTMSRPSLPSIWLASKLLRKSMVRWMRACSSSKLVSVSGLTGQARGPALDHVAGDLDLLGQRQHVREEAGLQESLRVDLLLLAMGGSLAEDDRQVVQDVAGGGHQGVVHGEAHDVFLRGFLGWGASAATIPSFKERTPRCPSNGSPVT